MSQLALSFMERFEEVLEVMPVWGIYIKIFCFCFIGDPKGFGCLNLNVTLMNSDVFGMGKKYN